MDKIALHERVLYPVVRVRANRAGGSGTIIYSQPDPQNKGDFLTFILTNWHVIESAVKTEESWDSVLKRDIKKEVLEPVQVEVFDYVHLSTVNSSNSHRAEIVAYDKNHDLAILRLHSPKEYPYNAELMDPEEAKEFKLFSPIWTSGCSLGHDPFANPGYITFLNETIQSKLFWMCNANIIFGNSGGGVFCGETGKQIGVTARVTVLPTGLFSVDITTWMGFLIPTERIFDFFEKQELCFLYDDEDTYYDALERRAERKREGLLSMMGQKEYETGAKPPKRWGPF